MEKLNVNHDADNTIKAFLGERDIEELRERIKYLIGVELEAHSPNSRIIENIVKREASNTTEAIGVTIIIINELRAYAARILDAMRQL